MKKKSEKTKIIICSILLVIILPILFVNVVILIKSYTEPNKIPGFMGYKPFIVMSGSMETQINTGDLVITKEIESSKLKIGDVIAFRIDEETVVTHRIVNIEKEDGKLLLTTKGDNNETEDDDKITEDKVEGIYLFKISGLGNVAMLLQTPIGLLIFASIPISIIVITQISNSKNYKKELEELKRKAKN